MSLTLIISAVIFTLLAVVVATSLLSGSSSAARAPERSGPKQNGHLADKKKEVEDDNDCGDVVKSVLPTEGATGSPGINDEVESDDDDSLKYVPGKARSHHLEKMMSTEELEEEQRVQREQLAAIFQLLRDNQETFGEVSEGDMEEQLKLYSI